MGGSYHFPLSISSAFVLSFSKELLCPSIRRLMINLIFKCGDCTYFYFILIASRECIALIEQEYLSYFNAMESERTFAQITPGQYEIRGESSSLAPFTQSSSAEFKWNHAAKTTSKQIQDVSLGWVYLQVHVIIRLCFQHTRTLQWFH